MLKVSERRLNRILELRGAALLIIRYAGWWETVSSTRTMTFRGGGLDMLLRSPFQPLLKPSEQHLYLAALHNIPSKPNLPFGLDIWCGHKKLNVEWDQGKVRVVAFHPGAWEELLVDLATKFPVDDVIDPRLAQPAAGRA